MERVSTWKKHEPRIFDRGRPFAKKSVAVVEFGAYVSIARIVLDENDQSQKFLRDVCMRAKPEIRAVHVVGNT